MSHPELKIRICEFNYDRHFEFALQHHLALVRRSFPHLDASEATARLYEAHVREAVRDACRRLWVGEVEGRPVALIEASFRPNFSPAVGHISEIYVVSEMRRRGIATRLMRTAEQWLREQGAVSVDLDVTAADAGAVAFYQKLGFTTHRLNMKKPLA